MIVVCGEALMDVFDAGATPTGQALDARIGGSPYNVALGLARLAQPVAFCGGISTGFLGERLMRSLADEGIGTGCVQRLDAPSSMCLVGLDGQGVPRYDFQGERGADRWLTRDVLDQLPPGVKAVHLGSYAAVVEPVASVYAELVQRMRGTALIAYDPNVRTVVEPDLGRWRDRLGWMLPHTQVLKISDEDLEQLFPGAAESDLVKAWLAAGPDLVVITRGSRGATAYAGAAAVHRASVSVTVVDTVGAGDTFQAAMLAFLAERGRLSPTGAQAMDATSLGAMLDFCIQAAGITCSRRGADLPRRGELNA